MKFHTYNFIKKSEFAKFLKTLILQNICERLLLTIYSNGFMYPAAIIAEYLQAMT